MVLKRLCNLTDNRTPLELMELPVPVPGEKEILLKVSACGVCHTELDEIEGRTPPSQLPVIPGHQVIGRVEAVGSQVSEIFCCNHILGISAVDISTCCLERPAQIFVACQTEFTGSASRENPRDSNPVAYLNSAYLTADCFNSTYHLMPRNYW